MKRINIFIVSILLITAVACSRPHLTDYVNPLLGTATLWDSVELGFKPTHRTWGGEVFPGASLPNAMVQLSPVTQWRSGSGYQYEDTVIHGFTHTNKGHWNLCHIPLMPVTGEFTVGDYASRFSHADEESHPGYYRVMLERYGVNVELTSTLRCAYHRYTFPQKATQMVIANLNRSNEWVRRWKINQQDDHTFTGFQQTGETMYFYAVSNNKVSRIDSLEGRFPARGMSRRDSLRAQTRDFKFSVPVVSFDAGEPTLELKIGFSFVSVEGAKANLEAEMADKSFADVRKEADATWERHLEKITVEGGTERQRQLFYSCFYRAFLWPALRSDVNGDYTDVQGKVCNGGFGYYTNPSFWDDYRNKLQLLGLLSPQVAVDVIRSITDKGQKRGGFMPTFFHGDHASTFVAGSWLRGLRGFDLDTAYRLLLRNATMENPSRPRLKDYMELGFIPDDKIDDPQTATVSAAGVTKTLEYSYDDYAVALLAKELGDTASYNMLMKRSKNYRNMFDPSTRFMRGRLRDGSWISPFNPYHPYFEYMYREATAWQSSFFAPHDVKGLIALYPDKAAFEAKLDSFFTVPWKGYEAHNFSGFLGQYCHGNQPDHNDPYLYYFIGKQEKTQAVLDTLMNYYYGIGKNGLALAGMDDAGELSSWFVLNAVGLYTFSPADPEYIITVPMFDKVDMHVGLQPLIIRKENHGRKIVGITYNGAPVEGWFLTDKQLKAGGQLVIRTE